DEAVEITGSQAASSQQRHSVFPTLGAGLGSALPDSSLSLLMPGKAQETAAHSPGGCLCPWCKRMLLPGSADVEEAKETEEETHVLKQSRCAQKCGSRRVRWTWECSLCDKAPGWLQLR
ncbi:mCG1035149, isoform CRA_a, partial [Mus musculus]